MQPEDKTQEIEETAERLQVIGSSILRAAREQFFLSDGWFNSWFWNGWKSNIFSAADAWWFI